MAIQEITDSEVVQRCAKCNAENRLLLSNLEVGVELGDGDAADGIVPLPECPTCGAREFLARSPMEEEHPAPGSIGHLHRLLVDELHAELVKRGRVVDRLRGKADTIFTRPIAAETKARRFDNGLRMPARGIEAFQGKETAR